MQTNRTNTHISAGDIAKSIVVGNQALTNHIVKQIANPAPKKIKVLRTNKCVFEQTEADLKPLQAYWPMMDKKARRMTMDNYRLEVAKKNNAIEAINTEIEKYNAQVEIFCAGELNEVQKAFAPLFLKNIALEEKKCKYEPFEYNQLVEEFNQEKGGLLIKKRKLDTIKYASEIVFENILHLYEKQLTKFTTEYIKFGSVTLKDVIAAEINSYHVTALERDLDDQTFVYSLNVCHATVRNHRKKLEKAGILTNYEFRGHKKGVKMHISNKILVLFDAKTGKYTNAENQSLTPETCKKFTDKDKALLEQSITIDKTENRKTDFPDLGTASPDLSFVFYGNIPAQDEKSKLGGRAENVKVSGSLSEKLQNITLSDTNLAQRLAGGEFFNHQRIDKVHLYQEAQNGTMIREEFLQVIKHEFFKNLSKIYRQSTPFAGSWQKAMNAFDDRFYATNSNGKFLVHKEVMVNILQKYLWMVNKAQRWFAKTGIRPLNPHDYLDRTRSHKKEIGFDYLEKAYAKHLKELETKPLKAKNAAKNAALRKQAINYNTKFIQKMNAFKKHRITLDELIDYVDKNLPQAFLQTLSDNLIKEMSYQNQYDC
jgi:hypothetical protein